MEQEQDKQEGEKGKLYRYNGEWLTAAQVVVTRTQERKMAVLRQERKVREEKMAQEEKRRQWENEAYDEKQRRQHLAEEEEQRGRELIQQERLLREPEAMQILLECDGSTYDEKTLQRIGDVCRIQHKMIQVAETVGQEVKIFPDFFNLQNLYRPMKGVHKDACFKKLIGLLTNANSVKNENSSWFLLRMITDLISSVQFKAKTIKLLWDSWLRGEYEEVVTKCSLTRIPDLVSLTKLLKKNKHLCSEINFVGERRFGVSKWAEILGGILPTRNIQNDYQEDKDSQEKRGDDLELETFHFRYSLRIQCNDKEPPTTSKISSKPPLQQLAKLRSVLTQLIHSLTQNEGAIVKLSELEQLYDEVNLKVKAESADDLPRLLRSYMQANGISSTSYFLWTVSYLITEINFGKFIMKDMWTFWLRGKYKTLVMQNEITQEQELISMTKFLGNVYRNVGCSDVVSEITGICSNTKWGKFIFLFYQFPPGTWERMRYIVMAGGKVKPIPTEGTTFRDLPNPQSSSNKPIPQRIPCITVEDRNEQSLSISMSIVHEQSAVPLSRGHQQTNYSVPPSDRQKETTQPQNRPVVTESWSKEKPDSSRNPRSSESDPTPATRGMQDPNSKSHNILKISQLKNPSILPHDKHNESGPKGPALTQSHSKETPPPSSPSSSNLEDANADAVVERVKTNLYRSQQNTTYHQSKSVLQLVKEKKCPIELN